MLSIALAILVISCALPLISSIASESEAICALASSMRCAISSAVDSGDEMEVMNQTLGETVESINRYISDIQRVLTQIAGGNLDTESQVDYKGDFALIQHSLGEIISSKIPLHRFPPLSRGCWLPDCRRSAPAACFPPEQQIDRDAL